jgi:hypothetical protein
MTSSRLSWFSACSALFAVLLLARPASAGYTHYWEWHADPDPKALAACIADMSRVIEARRRILTDGQGRTGADAVFLEQQVFGDAGAPVPAVVFNGIGDDAHEAFGFPLAPFTSGDSSFQFVKTVYKPYDEVVTACLIVARDYFPREVVTISSDGDWQDWRAGAALYERVLRREAHDPMDERTDWPADAPGEPATTHRSTRENLLVSALVFLALAVGYLLLRRGR